VTWTVGNLAPKHNGTANGGDGQDVINNYDTDNSTDIVKLTDVTVLDLTGISIAADQYSLLRADTLYGGTGNDTYIVDDSGDKVMENVSQGNDTVQSSVSFTLAADVENLILTKLTALSGTGNDGDNRLTGNTSKNTLDGGAGNDWLDGLHRRGHFTRQRRQRHLHG
jgi:Ca2+-binding RTX toxin-like protein